MGRVLLGWRALFVLVTLAFLPAAASAGQKIAIFPFDLVQPKSEEDYFLGPKTASKDEERRLELALAELARLVAADTRYEVVDLGGFAQEITAAAPINQCNGCEIDFATKANAELAMTSVVEKISETHLSLNVAIVDVAKGALVKNSSVLIQGNTDESWLHGVRWIAKNRLLAEGAKK